VLDKFRADNLHQEVSERKNEEDDEKEEKEEKVEPGSRPAQEEIF